MPWRCPSCGRINHETFENCSCGYSESGGVLTKQDPNDFQRISEGGAQYADIPSDVADDQGASQGIPESHEVPAPVSTDSPSGMPDEEVIKEIDSWLFTFSRKDGTISIGTPALRSFRLRLSTEDLEDLLEFAYQKSGNEKTVRKLNLAVTDIIGVVDKVDRLIEEKRSKVSIKFTSDELQEVADFINLQLKV